jgi:hypothetical protein
MSSGAPQPQAPAVSPPPLPPALVPAETPIDQSRIGRGQVALRVGAVAVATLLLLALTLRRGLNHDEHQFVAGAALLARDGLMPYRDFAWFHVPNLLYLYAALFTVSDLLLLTARLLSVAAVALLAGLLLASAPRRLGSATGRLRTIDGAGPLVLLLLIGSAAFLHASGRAWNHDLPIALTVAAFLALVRGLDQGSAGGRGGRWSLLAGLLLGLAAGTRLSFAPLALPFLAAPWLWPGTMRERLVQAAAIAGGMLLGLLPVFHALGSAPAGFLFGNFRYAQLNTAWYRALEPSVSGATPVGKLLDGVRFLVQPANLPLLLLTAAALWRVRGAVRRGSARDLRLWLLLLPFVAMGILAPTPMQMQYLYVLFPLLALALLLALRHDSKPATMLPWLAGAALVTMVLATPAYAAGLAILPFPSEWAPLKIHARGLLMADLAASGPDSGTSQAVERPHILTLSPIDPLEGDATIDPRLATGPFAWRVAPLLTPDERARNGMVGPDELDELLAGDPPRALFAGLHDDDADAEARLRSWVATHGYVAAPMPDEGTLYLSPLARWREEGGATIRLGAHTLPREPVAPGEETTFTLYLQSDGPTAANLNLLVRAVDAAGNELFRQDGWPFGAATSGWEPGALWLDGHTVRLSSTAAPGLHRVEASLYDPATLESAGEVATVGWLQVAPAATPPPPLARFDDALALVDLQAPATLQAGETLTASLTWQVMRTPESDLTRFVHLAPAGSMEPLAQTDAPPTNGFAPTTLWPVGLVQADALTLPLPADMPPGDYTLYVGLYDPATGRRLPVSPPAEAEAFAAATITIAP